MKEERKNERKAEKGNGRGGKGKKVRRRQEGEREAVFLWWL